MGRELPRFARSVSSLLPAVRSKPTPLAPIRIEHFEHVAENAWHLASNRNVEKLTCQRLVVIAAEQCVVDGPCAEFYFEPAISSRA